MRDALFFIAAAPQPSPDGASAAPRLPRRRRGAGRLRQARRYGRIDAAGPEGGQGCTGPGQGRPGTSCRRRSRPGAGSRIRQSAGRPWPTPATSWARRPWRSCCANSCAPPAIRSPSGRSDQFSLEMATAMLFVEHGLDQIRQLPDDFDAHAEVVGARLLALAAGETPPDAPQWQGDLSRQIQQGPHRRRAGRRNEEPACARSRRCSTITTPTPPSGRPWPDRSGAAPVAGRAGHPRPGRRDARGPARPDAVRTLVAAEGNPEQEAAVAAEHRPERRRDGLLCRHAGQNFDAAKDRFSFDAAAGMLREVPFEKLVAGETRSTSRKRRRICGSGSGAGASASRR